MKRLWLIAIAFLILVPLCDLLWFHTIFPVPPVEHLGTSIRDVANALQPDTVRFHRSGLYVFYFYDRNQRVFIKEINGEWAVLGWAQLDRHMPTAEEIDWMVLMGRLYMERVKQKPLWDNRMKAYDPLTGEEMKIR